MRPVNGILLDRQKLGGAAAFAQGVLFSAKASIDKSKDAECGPVIRLCLNDLFLRRARSGKRRLSGGGITFHSGSDAFTECAAILNGVGSVGVVAEITEGASYAVGVALCKTQENANRGKADAGRGILLNNRFDQFMQGPRIRFPGDPAAL